jgi:hypothetical protein
MSRPFPVNPTSLVVARHSAAMSHNPIGGCAEGVRSQRTCNVRDAAHHLRLIPDANVDPCAVIGLEVCSNATGNPHEYFDHTRLLQRVDVVFTRGADALADADRL